MFCCKAELMMWVSRMIFEEEQVGLISDVDFSPYELTFMDCAWDGVSDTIGAITVEATAQLYHHHEAFAHGEDVLLDVDAQIPPH